MTTTTRTNDTNDIKSATLQRIARELVDLRAKISESSNDNPDYNAWLRAELAATELNLRWWTLSLARSHADSAVGALIREQQDAVSKQIDKAYAKSRRAWRKHFES